MVRLKKFYCKAFGIYDLDCDVTSSNVSPVPKAFCTAPSQSNSGFSVSLSVLQSNPTAPGRGIKELRIKKSKITEHILYLFVFVLVFEVSWNSVYLLNKYRILHGKCVRIYGIYACVGVVSEMSLLHYVHSFDFWYKPTYWDLNNRRSTKNCSFILVSRPAFFGSCG